MPHATSRNGAPKGVAPKDMPARDFPARDLGQAPDALTGLSDTERDRIRWRAHALWREDGCPQGRDREYWERAELEILKGRRSF